VREAPAPRRGAPTLLLLHGWTGTADQQWAAAYAALGERYRAVDHRGHGLGVHDDQPFTLEDCADDAAALVECVVGGPVVVVGHSMGGAVAQLFWRRHPHLVGGLVLCSTAASFQGIPNAWWFRPGLLAAQALARVTGPTTRRRLGARLVGTGTPPEVTADHDWRRVVEAGRAVLRFDARQWLEGVDVPASVLVTDQDQLIPPSRQLELAERVDACAVVHVPGDHAACLNRPAEYVRTLLGAVVPVVGRQSLAA
jgi:3-oxoadipate enol-lactonase